MSETPRIDVRDLSSVRQAADATEAVVLGEDWLRPEDLPPELGARRRWIWPRVRWSPITRKIVLFNLLGLCCVIAGVLLVLGPPGQNAAVEQGQIQNEALLIADVIEAQMPRRGPVSLISGDGINVQAVLEALRLRDGLSVVIFDQQGALVAQRLADPDGAGDLVVSQAQQVLSAGAGDHAAVTGGAVGPLRLNGGPLGSVVVVDQADPARMWPRALLWVFGLGALASLFLSLTLASTIATPLQDLADAAELGRDKNARTMTPGQVRIPDLSARPDEIGRLSGALRGMVAALYDRIESNEQFAADVAHEIKNPLASLQSAVGTLRGVDQIEKREKLLEVIEHDVQRLNRLVSDISNASRLDSELVKEQEEAFDLLKLLRSLSEHLGAQAEAEQIDFISDLPDGKIFVTGLEARLAQVFVNLVTNAMSFCEDGDAIRLWARRRENRVLVVVEDTGPGIPETALKKVFQRFYSERPEGQFGDNSGLGLAISKQIVEAHGGVIWAENIRPTAADPGAEPLGARFVVGLPL